ncbi:MAG: acyl-CoA dehydrogenase [Rhodocyclaceae bacterium]|nr:MAG: acyl-CoA dehydrogenase [Rhodocyclaceae bacterium]
MSLILTEEQTMLRDSAHEFLSDRAPVKRLRELRDSRDAAGYSRPLWQQFAEMGFTGVLVPEAFGGLGLGHVEAGVVMEQIGHQLASSPFLSSSIAAVCALRHAGSETQQQAWLPRLASGAAIATLAIDETTKHRPAQTALRGTPTGQGFVLNGAKTFVLDAHVADLLIVAARTAGQPGNTAGITLFLVDPKVPGIEIERSVMVDSHNAGRIRFTDLPVSADAVLGQAGDGWKTLNAGLDAGRAAAAAELLGLADEAFARTVAYLKERRQFDRVIGEFQGLQHRASELYCELEITRAAVINAQQLLDADIDKAGEAVAVAKARAGRTATLAVQEAVQMHGGMGMTDEFEIGFFMKRARVLQELFGDANFHLDQLARKHGY